MPRDDTQDIPEYYGWKLFHIDRKIRKLPYSEIINPTKKSRKKNLTRFASDVTVSQPRRKGFTKCLHKLNFQSLIAWSALIIISLFSISLSFHFYLVSFDQLLQPVEKSLHVYISIISKYFIDVEKYISSRIYCEYKYNGLNY